MGYKDREMDRAIKTARFLSGDSDEFMLDITAQLPAEREAWLRRAGLVSEKEGDADSR